MLTEQTNNITFWILIIIVVIVILFFFSPTREDFKNIDDYFSASSERNALSYEHDGGVGNYICSHTIPYQFWSDDHREAVIQTINFRDAFFEISYLKKLNNFVLYLLLQSHCGFNFYPQVDCSSMNDDYRYGIPYYLWNDKDRTAVVSILHKIYPNLSMSYLMALDNKTLELLTRTYCV